jgi:hypothetical protein
MRAADTRPADMRPADMRCPANMRPTDMRRPDMRPPDMRRVHPTAAACPNTYSAAVSAKPAAVSTTMPAATVSATAARVCFECEKRHDEEQHRGHASADRQHRPQGGAGLGAPHPRGRLSLGIPPRTKSF